MERRNVRRYRKRAAEQIGRALSSSEVVHHKDRDFGNDAPDNLEVMPRPAHGALHAREQKAGGYHTWFLLDAQDASLEDIFWSRLAKIDLSEIAK